MSRSLTGLDASGEKDAYPASSPPPRSHSSSSDCVFSASLAALDSSLESWVASLLPFPFVAAPFCPRLDGGRSKSSSSSSPAESFSRAVSSTRLKTSSPGLGTSGESRKVRRSNASLVGLRKVTMSSWLGVSKLTISAL